MAEEYSRPMAREPHDLLEDVPVADLRTRMETILEQIQSTRRPVVVTQEGQDAAVLVDIESYRSLLEELELLKDVHRGLADIEAGRVIPHEEVRAFLLDRYK